MNTVNTNKTAKIECYITEDLIDLYDSNTHSHCYFLKAYPEDDSELYSFYFTNV